MSDLGTPASVPAAPTAPASGPAPRLRLWPSVVIVMLEWIGIILPAWLAPLTMVHFMGWFFAPMVATAALVVWWIFASRLRWTDRLLTVLVFAACCVAVVFLSHPTVGLYGTILYALPWLTTVWILWLAATPFVPWPRRRAGFLAAFVLVAAGFLLVRSEGVTGSLHASWRLRWAQTPEDQLLADIAAHKLDYQPASTPEAAGPVSLQPGDWPAFRGPNRDSQLTRVRITPNWNEHSPRQVWRHRVGPGWSSFAVVGGRLYTQEQRGPEEVVACYDAATGSQFWAHADNARFTESLGGPGPRATPTFADGNLYVQGATGLLNCLDAATGKVIWQHDLKTDAQAKLPMWGFAGSPLVTGKLVLVFAGGPEGSSVLAYDARSGKRAWSAGKGQTSYSSPHLARLAGVEQVLMITDLGLTSYAPDNGQVLWQHDWPSPQVVRVVQPMIVDDADVLIGTSGGMGTRQIHVNHNNDGWTTQEVRTMRTFRPYYNDLVLYRGNLYGFDGFFFTCVSLADGKSKWRTRQYGSGQVLMLAEQGLLLVLSEQGEAALVEATPDGHRERCRFQALEGKTWNHPVVAHGKLFVRNGEEAACYELTEEETHAVAGHH